LIRDAEVMDIFRAGPDPCAACVNCGSTLDPIDQIEGRVECARCFVKRLEGTSYGDGIQLDEEDLDP
jgi:hypothetical protein